ncbi:ATP-binding protein [Sinomicrobium sp. M5D2P17]
MMNKNNSPHHRQVQQVLQASPVGAFQTDMDGNCFFVNRSWEDMSGLGFEESLGKKWMEIIAEEDIPAISHIIQQAIEGVKEVSFIYRIQHPEKGLRYFKTDARPILNKEENEKYFLGYIQDITETKLSTVYIDKQNKLFRILKDIQDRFYLGESPYALFNKLLENILEITESKFGFIGEIIRDKHGGQPYLKTLAISNITWDEASRKIYEDTKTEGVVFTNLDSLFGQVISSGEPYISNAPETDEKRGGTPEGHPRLDSFLGLPAKTKDKLVGMIGVANRKNGYDLSLVEFLDPLLSTFASLVAFHRLTIAKKAADTRKEELNNHLQSLISSLEDIILEIDGNLVFRNVWARNEDILFVPKERFIGKKLTEVFGERASFFADHIRRVIRTGKTREFEYKHLDPSVDKWYKAKVTPINRDPRPDHYKMAIFVRDITEKTKYIEDLKTEKEKLEYTNLLFDFSQELSKIGGWENNLETGKVVWTKQTHAILGISPEYIQHTTYRELWDLLEEMGAGLIKDQALKTLKNKKPYDVITRITTLQGDRKWIRSIGIPIVKSSKVVLLRGVLLDVTRQKETELILEQTKNAAEAAARAKTDFLSVMSHEIRTPLNGIIGITNLLKLNHTPEQEEYINNLMFSADHLLQLINDILDLNKIESDKLELVYTEIDLPELIFNIKSQFQSLADVKGIKLFSRIDRNIPRKIIGDAVRISQILNNLVSNAVKFTEKGEVSIMLQQLSATPTHTTIHFSVRDTGLGIPKKMQETIFESFKQIQQEAYRKHSGTGLGLTITKKLIELHNSHIAVKSKRGKGTEFSFDITLELPSEKNRKRLAPKTLSGFENGLSGIKLLFVEDNRVNALVARKQLEYFGIKPDHAQNGDEALEFLCNTHYHVALIDLHMPQMDGYRLSEIITRDYPDIHIVIFTADIMTDVKQRLARMGIYDILNKPFVPTEMLSVLLKVANSKKLLPDGEKVKD